MTKPTTRVLAIFGAGLLALSGCTPPIDETIPAHTEVISSYSPELNSSLPKEIKERGHIVFGGEPNGPWRIVTGMGDIAGFQSDLLQELSVILGIAIKTETADLATIKLGVQSGRIDAAFGPILDSPEARKDLLIINFHTARPAFVHLPDRRISSSLDLCGSTIAFVGGSAPMVRVLERLAGQCEDQGQQPPRTFAQTQVNGIMMALLSGRADFAATNAASATFTVSQRPQDFSLYLAPEAEFSSDYLGMAVAKENGELHATLLQAWELLFANGSYDFLMEKYGLEEIKIDRPFSSQ